MILVIFINQFSLDNDMVIGTEDNEAFNNVCNDEGVIATATSNLGDNIHTASRGIESTKTPWISFKSILIYSYV